MAIEREVALLFELLTVPFKGPPKSLYLYLKMTLVILYS